MRFIRAWRMGGNSLFGPGSYPGVALNNVRKYNQWSANSPLCRVPEHLRNRCHRSGCLGAIECPVWRQCGPATPFGGYGAHLAALPVLVGNPRPGEVPRVPA
jgi:hypothetical protein